VVEGKKKNRRFIYSLARSSHLLFASLALLVGAGKRLVQAGHHFPGGWVASLVNPLSVDDDTSVYAISTNVRKNRSLKDGKLHGKIKWLNAPREKGKTYQRLERVDVQGSHPPP